jgi:major membrane immunogen (membrane-anchored lipoprotein)
MVRKFAAALVALVIAFGSVFADEVKGAFVKFADGTLTIKVDDKDKEYKIPADLKMKRKGKDGTETETVVTESLTKMNDSKFRPTVVLTVDGEKVTAVKYEFKGKGKGKDKDKNN